MRRGIVAAVVGAVLLAASGTALAADGPRALQQVTLQLNWKHQFQFAGYYAAVEKGYFRAEGLEVVIREVQAGQEPIDAVLSGQAEFGVGASELVLRRARGAPVVVLAVIFQHSPLVLIARGDGLQSLHELAGKRVMLMPHETELYAYLAREGVARGRFEEVQHTFDVADLIEGRVEALSGYSTDEPFVLRRAGLRHSIFSPRASAIDFYGDSLFTTERMVERDPGRVAAFRRASIRGWQYALEHPGEIADLILRRYSTRHDREHLLFEAAELRRLMQPQLIEIGHINPGRWQHIAGVYAELGMLPGDWTLDGFIYDPDPHVDLRRLYRVLTMVIIALVVIGLFGVRQVRFNRLLRAEVVRRGVIEQDLRAANARLEVQLAEIEGLRARLEEQAVRDSLTGLYNRRYLDDALDRELTRAQRYGYPVSLVLTDIDSFKQLNDTYGHQAGDAVLQAVAAALNQRVRAGDLLCRWGGEEFVLLMPTMSAEDAFQRAETWRESIGSMRVAFGAFELTVTLSVGVAAYPGDGLTPARLLEAADRALYRAKSEGRNRVRMADGGGGRQQAAAPAGE